MGQREAAAPTFLAFFDHPRRPESAASRTGLSAICQSESPLRDGTQLGARPLARNTLRIGSRVEGGA